jgi:hypothetical protein
MNEKTRKLLEGNKKHKKSIHPILEKDKPKRFDAGVVVISPNDTMSSVKIYPVAGEIRVEVKAYSTSLPEAAELASKIYDEYSRKYANKKDKSE